MERFLSGFHEVLQDVHEGIHEALQIMASRRASKGFFLESFRVQRCLGFEPCKLIEIIVRSTLPRPKSNLGIERVPFKPNQKGGL